MDVAAIFPLPHPTHALAARANFQNKQPFPRLFHSVLTRQKQHREYDSAIDGAPLQLRIRV